MELKSKRKKKSNRDLLMLYKRNGKRMEISNILAENLKNLRQERNLSLGQLSELCGISKVQLSQIERGDTNPTINTIWKIAKGLNISYTKLLEQNRDEITVVHKEDAISQNGDDEHYRIFCYYENTPHRNFELFQMELDSDHEYRSIGHSEQSQEYIMVMSGELTLSLNGKSYVLKKNDTISFDASVEHIYQSTGKQELKTVIINYYG